MYSFSTENKEAISDSKASDRAAESVQCDRQATENKSVAWRKKFSTKQRKQLEDSFKEQKYLSVKQRDILANDIKLSSEQVKTWYQNRRTRWRKNQIAKLRDSFWRTYPSWEYIQTETRSDEV